MGVFPSVVGVRYDLFVKEPKHFWKIQEVSAY